MTKRGFRHTPEAIAKIRAANLGRKHTPEAIAKMRAGQRLRRQRMRASSQSDASDEANVASADEREAVTLAEAGKSDAEIAEWFGWTVEHVRRVLDATMALS